MPSEPQPDTSRNVYAFGATSLLNDTASEMAYWIVPAFLISIGAGPAALGLIEGIAESVASFNKLFSGYLTDRLRRRKPIVATGYIVANGLKPLLAIATSWWQVLLIRFGDRFGKGVRGAPRDVMLAESVEPGKVGSAFGLLQAMDSAGAIVGPLIALLLIGRIGYRGVFWMAAIPGLLSVFVLLAFARETGRSSRRKTGSAHVASSAPLPGAFYYMLGAVALFSLGNSSDMFLVLRAQSIGIPATHAPLLGLVFNLTFTLFSWPAGHISDRFPRQALVAGGYVVFAAVYLVFALAPSKAAIWTAMACYGLYYALTNPVLRAMVVDHAPAEARGRAFGIFYFVASVDALLASVITGQLWKHYGPRLPLMISAVLAAIAAMMLLAWPARRATSR